MIAQGLERCSTTAVLMQEGPALRCPRRTPFLPHHTPQWSHTQCLVDVLRSCITHFPYTTDPSFNRFTVVGSPSEVLKAFDALRADLLPAVSLQCNTSKSHFAYFHDDAAPLLRFQRKTLADHDVQFHDRWVPVLGALQQRPGCSRPRHGCSCLPTGPPERVRSLDHTLPHRLVATPPSDPPAPGWS